MSALRHTNSLPADRDASAAPEAWVRAAQELPQARRELDEIVARAEADAGFREALIADLESALRAEGIEPTPPLLDELRRRVAD